jgi:hypothetical protein
MQRVPGVSGVIDKCQSLSTYKRFTLANWPQCGARSRWARWARRGDLRWARSGPSFAASQACGPTATTFFCTTTRLSFLYQDPAQLSLPRPGFARRAPILCDFGVEVTRTFETVGEVYSTETPVGEAAVAVHRDPYNRIKEAHDPIRKWMAANRRESAGHSWEIYGDPAPDLAKTETTVVYLLK